MVCPLFYSFIALCSSYLDVLGTLVKLSEADRPSGIQVEVLRAVQNMVILLDEQFLVHSVVHKAVLRLLRNCVGDDIQEQLDNRNRKVMGAAKNVVRSSPSEYEEDREWPFSRYRDTLAPLTRKRPSCQPPFHLV
jgi:Retinoic acid induced 16-like protein